jgi:hypothetical protein
VDIGVCMSRATLRDKLSLRHDPNPETTWNLKTWPQGFRDGDLNCLFVAADGAWRGYFTFTDALFNPRDRAAPYAILIDTRSWTPISPVPVHRFRGFTYDVPTPTLTPTSNTSR